jgi:hypothetical protein
MLDCVTPPTQNKEPSLLSPLPDPTPEAPGGSEVEDLSAQGV